MVAKSYQTMEQMCNPYELNGKMYVKVKNPKTGAARQVRWYSEAEYKKLYGEPAASNKANDPFYKTQKEVLGFIDGYITICAGNTYEHIDWFRASTARYSRDWGWFFNSDVAIPLDLPSDVVTIRLDWDSVGNSDGTLLPDKEIKAVVDKLVYPASDSEYQGEIGQRLELYLTVTAAHKSQNSYGEYNIFHMEDEKGNRYMWSTSTKDWISGYKCHIKGTVKDYKIYKNAKTTILTRCSEIK